MVRSRAALLTLERLATAPKWPSERTAELAGRVRGVALAGWAANVRKRFGHTSSDAVRSATGLDFKHFPDDPARDSWWPAHVHLRVTEAIVDQCLRGDSRRLVEPWRDDVEQKVPGAARIAARLLGPRGLLGRAMNGHRWLYDVGHLKGELESDTAELTWTGAPLFTQPTWRLVMSMALVAGLEIAGTIPTNLEASEPCPDAFRLHVAW